jgi:hypothetical protein
VKRKKRVETEERDTMMKAESNRTQRIDHLTAEAGSVYPDPGKI